MCLSNSFPYLNVYSLVTNQLLLVAVTFLTILILLIYLLQLPNTVRQTNKWWLQFSRILFAEKNILSSALYTFFIALGYGSFLGDLQTAVQNSLLCIMLSGIDR